MTELYGTIKLVAKTGGIILNENDTEWLNPANPEIKDKIIQASEQIKNKGVNITLDENRKYTNVVLAEDNTIGEAPEEYVEEDVDIEAENKLDEKIHQQHQEKTKQVFSGMKIEDSKENQEPTEENYFTKLNKIKCKVEKKGNLNYVSWAEAWNELKKRHPDSKYEIFCNDDGLPYFRDEAGVFAKVGVTVDGIEHIMVLPVLDHFNKAVEKPDIFQINKTIMRCFAKAMAMHGIGTYVFLGEDLPSED